MKPLAVIVLLLASCSVRAEPSLESPQRRIDARVLHVSDGDSIVLDGIDVGEPQRGGRKARLIGVDTPELHEEPECFGRQASDFTERELEHTRVRVTFDVDPIDRYGRALVYVWEPDGRLFNARLLEEGYAQQLTVPPNVRYVEQLSAATSRARSADKGLWSACR